MRTPFQAKNPQRNRKLASRIRQARTTTFNETNGDNDDVNDDNHDELQVVSPHHKVSASNTTVVIVFVHLRCCCWSPSLGLCERLTSTWMLQPMATTKQVWAIVVVMVDNRDMPSVTLGFCWSLRNGDNRSSVPMMMFRVTKQQKKYKIKKGGSALLDNSKENGGINNRDLFTERSFVGLQARWMCQALGSCLSPHSYHW